MPTITQHLLALGEWDATFDWDPDLATLLARFHHVTFWWGQRRIYSGVVLSGSGDRYDGLHRAGRSVEWHLGVDNTIPGPVIEDRRYFSGANKLSNGDFELGELDWKSAEDSEWSVSAGAARQGAFGASVSAAIDRDDIFQADEPFPVRPGDELRLSGYAYRPTGTIGRLRPRVVFDGRFGAPNLLTNPGFETGGNWTSADGFDIVTDAGEARAGTGVLRVDLRLPLDILVNGGFETGDYTGWPGFGAIGHWSVQTTNPWEGTYSLRMNIATSGGAGVLLGSDTYNVIPGAEYRVRVRGLAVGTPDAVFRSFIRISSSVTLQTEELDLGGIRGDMSTNWQTLEYTFNIPEDRDRLRVLIGHEAGGTVGDYYIDGIQLEQMHGIKGTVEHDPVDVTPERTYRFAAEMRSGPGAVEGSVKPYVICSGTGRDDVRFEGTPAELTENDWRVLEVTFTPPSGYDTVVPAFESEDVRGGDYWWIDQAELRDTDTSTRVSDVVVGPAAADWTAFSQDVTAPEGTDTARVELVAESEGDGWRVDDVDFKFINVDTPTVAEVARELLTHPDTGLDLLVAGAISGSETIAYDWWIRNMPLRSAIRQLAQGGLASPVKEWVTDPDGTFRFGTADELFEDRTQMVITAEDAHVVAPPGGLNATFDVEDTGETVRLYGATRPAVQQRRFKTYSAIAENPTMGTDFLGNPLARVLVVEDSTIDHTAFAGARARVIADERAEPDVAITVALNDWMAVSEFNVGDWIYLYLPDHGIEDLANQVTLDDGRITFPVRKRVLGRTWTLGEGPFRCEAYENATSDPVDITDQVQWAAKTGATLEVGDLLPDFTTDPQGGGAYRQYLRFRASQPAT